MQREFNQLNKFHTLSVLAFVVFCFAIGEIMAILLTGLLYNLTVTNVFEILKAPAIGDRPLILSLASLSTLFRFLVIPGLYLACTNKSSLSFLWTNTKIKYTPLLLTIALVFVLIPLISIFIEINHNLALPVWLSELEMYFKESEEKVRVSTNFLLTFSAPWDLIIVTLVVAVIPGILEEIFFRGMVQRQLQQLFKNHHHAILLSSFLFSCLHFQFYGLVPRMVAGVLFGYLFFWSKNIWYPIVAHVVNNLIGVLGVYFFGLQVINSENGNPVSMMLLFPSVIVSTVIIFYLRRVLVVGSKDQNDTTSRPYPGRG